MGHGKSPVDELVDGIDAIGTILDENLPQMSSRIDEMVRQVLEATNRLAELKILSKEVADGYTDLRKGIATLDIRVEEILATIGALTRRIDLLQKSVLELTDSSSHASSESDLSDTVKMLEDRLKKIEERLPSVPTNPNNV
jgi:chromosome segregation ATPase